jgi:hypothetical protein
MKTSIPRTIVAVNTVLIVSGPAVAASINVSGNGIPPLK